MAVWPGDPEVELATVSSVEKGDPVTVTRIAIGSHTGTHVDAAAHLIAGGAPVEQIPLQALLGPCQVVDVTGCLTAVQLDALSLPPGTSRLLLRTAAGREPAALTADGAEWLVAHGIQLIGTEAASIESANAPAGLLAHRVLLTAGVVIAEGLDLGPAAPGRYELICLPLRLAGIDGSPARVLLRPC